MKVPFLDLGSHHAPFRAEFRAAIDEVIDTGAFGAGRPLRSSKRTLRPTAIAATLLVWGAARRLFGSRFSRWGWDPVMKSITVPATFMATAEAISYCGAKPVFVDVDERTYTMDSTPG